MHDETGERYSLCIPCRARNGHLYYYRIADYDPQRPFELAPAMLRKDATSEAEKLSSPDTLYNPRARKRYDSRDADFIYLRWHQDPSDPSKQITTSIYDERGQDLKKLPEPMEVIICRDSMNEKDLREALATGIEFEGKITRRFYIVYSRTQDACYAILCDRSEVLFQNGTITLRKDFASPRSTILSAPKIQLRLSDILESPFDQTGHRMVCANLDEPKETGRIPLRPLSYYAADYVNWFMDVQQLSSKDERTRKFNARLVETALSRPESIRDYLKADEYDSEVESLRVAIADYANGADDALLSSIADALLECEPLHQRCIREVSEKAEGSLAELKKRKESAKEMLESLEFDIEKKTSEIQTLKEQKKSVDADMVSARNAIAKLEQDKENVLANLEDNIALKLGFRTMANSIAPKSSFQGEIHAIEGVTASAQSSTEPPVTTLAKNLQRLGLLSLAGDTSNECRRLATSMLAALSATSFLVAPAGISYAIADALSIASSDITARRIHVPSEYPNIENVTKACEGPEPVVVIENLIDSVNEGILLPLLSRNIDKAVILPYTSMDSMGLVAKEAWGSMFLLRGYPLVKLKREPNLSKAATLSKNIDDMLFPRSIYADDMIDEAQDMADELAESGIPHSSLPLASTIVLAIEQLTEDAEARPFIAQHFAVASKTAKENNEAAESIRDWAGGDKGFDMFFEEYASQE